MAASIGREAVLTVDSTAVGGVRELGVSVNKEPIDITDFDSSGYREVLPESGTQTLEFTLSGVTKDRVLREMAHGTEALSTLSLTYANADTLSGSFKMTSYSEGMPVADAQTFEATFISSGQWTYTAASP